MSKRTDTIRSLFAQPPAPMLSADNNPEPRRVAAGAVRSMKETFSDIERENEMLRARIAAGEQVVDIDPGLVDPSPFADRFPQEEDASFEALKQSIGDRGQEVPVLLRVNPALPGRYQTAFGHRRIRAALQLGRPVKAIIRALGDDDLIIAQGVENSAREDLSFIERAVFAWRLESAGRSRSVIQQALAIDRAEASKLISVAKAVPEDVVRAIGRAPRIGRGRWQEFAELLRDAPALRRARAAAALPAFSSLDGDTRFARTLAAAKRAEAEPRPARPIIEIRNSAGQSIAEIRASERDVRVTLAKADGSAFAQFLAARLPELLEEYRSFDAGDGASKGA
ncbi:plasmid partitioning protein RepB [Methylosinus sp. R-45379]|jgi:ParB family chromosome partitioning protein|uniref:plasmid partitioning protein RepB n=1 Tax=unclassified Methylosinus TaxID=2624500 RepID=UPI00046760A5|nr:MULTISPECIES: plasmid partitioning protein RepB [unclassified Methylosinus]OAI31628.1 plasmid partitioning protein RepB [Methylosinus sp. R-45379]TDX62591.1 ParB family chromosome partitioning protein [Methylosinus sp. sav-2]